MIRKLLLLTVNFKTEDRQRSKEGRGCIADRIFTLTNITEQCTEWQWSLYVNFVDFAKAFNSGHWYCLWRTLHAFGIPLHFTSLKYRSFFNNIACCVGDGDIPFEVKASVRQACVLSTVLFNLVVDWILECGAPQWARSGASTNPRDNSVTQCLRIASGPQHQR